MPASSVEVPAEFCDGSVFVQVRAGRSGPLWFLVDTGSPIDVISAKHLRSSGIRALSGLTINGTTNHLWCQGAPLTLGGVRYTPERLGASQALESWEGLHGHRFDGILGLPLLHCLVAEIDHGSRRVWFHDRRSFRHDGSGVRLPLRKTDPRPFVSATVRLPDGHTLTDEFIVDSGFTGAAHLPTGFDKASPTTADQRFEVEGETFGGSHTSCLVRLDSIELAGVRLRRPIAAVSDRFNATGLLGAAVLSRFRLFLDLKGGQLIVEPTRSMDTPFEEDMSGVSVKAAGARWNEFTIRRVRAGSPAERAGCKAGDALKRIDGKPASRWELIRLREHWRCPGHDCSLLLRRGGKDVNVSFQTKRQI